jgi:formylglycine-generating enzyme required for sulfatase activity
VRIELESALRRGIPVVPVLIDGTPIPTEPPLPDSLSNLRYRQAIDLDQGRDFHLHVDRLIQGIEIHLRTGSLEADELVRRAKHLSSERESATVSKQTNSIGMKLVRIEAGQFLMGTNTEQVNQWARTYRDFQNEALHDEQPQHPVRISRDYFLGIHEITQGQYRTVLAKNPSAYEGRDDLPVESVSWFEAIEFCNKLSEREKRRPFYLINGSDVTINGGDGYRLPTEAEWEYACKARSITFYHFGDDVRNLEAFAWYERNAGRTTHPVGTKLPNGWGLFDMLGNVYEWCFDGYSGEYYRMSPVDDPIGATSKIKVIRGGSWRSAASSCRSARRWSDEAEFRSEELGFRVARGTE